MAISRLKSPCPVTNRGANQTSESAKEQGRTNSGMLVGVGFGAQRRSQTKSHDRANQYMARIAFGIPHIGIVARRISTTAGEGRNRSAPRKLSQGYVVGPGLFGWGRLTNVWEYIFGLCVLTPSNGDLAGWSHIVCGFVILRLTRYCDQEQDKQRECRSSERWIFHRSILGTARGLRLPRCVSFSSVTSCATRRLRRHSQRPLQNHLDACSHGKRNRIAAREQHFCKAKSQADRGTPADANSDVTDRSNQDSYTRGPGHGVHVSVNLVDRLQRALLVHGSVLL
jgi:hypothetical protein